MLDREVGLARGQPEGGADVPTACEIRVQNEGAVDQRYHGADILAEIRQGESGIYNSARIVTRHLQGLPGVTGALAAVLLGVSARPLQAEPVTTHCGVGESGSVSRIARDRLLEKTERFGICRADDLT